MLAITTFGFLFCEIYFIKVIGVGISIAVILDASIIRMVLVPASIKLFGEYNFYNPAPLKVLVAWVGLQDTEEFAESLSDEERLAAAALLAQHLPLAVKEKEGEKEKEKEGEGGVEC